MNQKIKQDSKFCFIIVPFWLKLVQIQIPDFSKNPDVDPDPNYWFHNSENSNLIRISSRTVNNPVRTNKQSKQKSRSCYKWVSVTTLIKFTKNRDLDLLSKSSCWFGWNYLFYNSENRMASRYHLDYIKPNEQILQTKT